MNKRPGRLAELSIGGLAAQSGCNIETIRYYERIKLMAEPPRTASGRRRYGDQALRRLRFIRRSRELGFSIGEIRGMLAMVDGGQMTCASILANASAHIADIRRKIADLERMAGALEAMAEQCHGMKVPQCAIVDCLSNDEG